MSSRTIILLHQNLCPTISEQVSKGIQALQIRVYSEAWRLCCWNLSSICLYHVDSWQSWSIISAKTRLFSYTILLLLLLLEYLYFFFLACGLLLILLLCFSEGLGISSEPVGYHSFGWAIGFRYRVICSHNFPLILGVIFLVKFDLLLLDAGS